MRRALVPVGLVAAFAAAAALGSSAATHSSQSPAVAEIDPSGAPPTLEQELAPAPSLTLALDPPARGVVYGDFLSLSGALAPAEAGREVVIELDSGTGWSEAAQITTGLDGSFAALVPATRSGLVRARTADGAVVSVAANVTVTPNVHAKPARGLAFGNARVAARIEPASYTGLVVIVVKRKGEEVARATAQVSNGRLRTNVPLPGIGRFTLALAFPEFDGLTATVVTARAVAKGRPLSVGSSGSDVRGLRERLAALRFHVPAPSATFSYELADALIAFQKAYSLERTGTVDPATWRALERVSVLRPRYQGLAVHIEVDKTRQILMVVQGGEVSAVLPVSSGATGNTPEGKHQIRWKALATTTWLGAGILYRTMTFYENSVAIHGWSSVPAYPASHGCVRIPIWTADWLYNQSSVGETVYVYS